jgi:hypothetical protein
MENDSRFSIDDPNIVSDLFDDEAVLVNLDSGIYYSLRNSAAQIWIRILNAYSLDEIVNDLGSMYDGDHTSIRKLTIEFIDSLLKDKMIVTANGVSRNKIETVVITPKPLFTAPVIEAFADMQDILLLDPVHDVDPSGWPITKDQSNS